MISHVTCIYKLIHFFLFKYRRGFRIWQQFSCSELFHSSKHASMTSSKMDLGWMKIPYLYTSPRKTHGDFKLSSLEKTIFLVPEKPWKSPPKKDPNTWVFKDPSKIKWDLTNGPRFVSCNRAIRYSGFFGVRSLGPVGDFLERMIPWIIRLPILKGQGFFPVDGRSWGVQEPQPASGRQGPTRSEDDPQPPPKSWVCVVFFFGGYSSDCHIY